MPPGCAPFDPNPRPARFRPPAGACDCHTHVFAAVERYPYTPNRSYTPPPAPLEALRHMMAVTGLERAVIVQPSVYGTDNRATLDAVAEGGPGFRAVVVVDDDIDERALAEMHEAGARGVRLDMLFAGGAEGVDLQRLAAKIRPFGWHLQMLIDVATFPDLHATFKNLPVPVVFDHMGHIHVVRGVDDPGFRALTALVAEGRAWAKLSGAYRLTAEAAPPYGDVAPFARALVAANPEQVVWASDWPHPSIAVAMPNDGALLDLLDDWVPDAATRDRILRDNPARLYGFEAVPGETDAFRES
ncbi:MAG: amidohydrolase family protein [Pseudomonadota bacterium]